MRKAKVRRTRAEKSEDARRALIDAGTQVVSKYGYTDASISRITEKANLAQGTFYNYFETRQDLLDILPPNHGEIMRDHIRANLADAKNGADREAKRLEAFFTFFEQNKYGARLMNEAPTLAPKGYEAFYAGVKEGYLRALRASIGKGELSGFSEDELEPLVDILIAIRTGLAQRYLAPKPRDKRNQTALLATYRKLIERALFSSLK